MIKKTCLAIGVWLKLVSSPVVFAQEKHSLQPEKKKFCEALNREMQITMGNWLATLNGWKAYDGARGEAIKEDKEALGQFIAERRDMIIENHQDNRIKLKDENDKAEAELKI